MRLFTLGEPFAEVRSEGYIPPDWAVEDMQDDLMRSDFPAPTFSEIFLYPRVGKDDARFILAVAAEYSAIIEELGEEEVKAILRRHREKA